MGPEELEQTRRSDPNLSMRTDVIKRHVSAIRRRLHSRPQVDAGGRTIRGSPSCRQACSDDAGDFTAAIDFEGAEGERQALQEGVEEGRGGRPRWRKETLGCDSLTLDFCRHLCYNYRLTIGLAWPKGRGPDGKGLTRWPGFLISVHYF